MNKKLFSSLSPSLPVFLIPVFDKLWSNESSGLSWESLCNPKQSHRWITWRSTLQWEGKWEDWLLRGGGGEGVRDFVTVKTGIAQIDSCDPVWVMEVLGRVLELTGFNVFVLRPEHLSFPLCRNNTVLNSRVVSVTIKPTPGPLSAPIEIEFSHAHNVSEWHTPKEHWVLVSCHLV